eukprot:6209676-Pleurochrysis_carterae.AAC.2
MEKPAGARTRFSPSTPVAPFCFPQHSSIYCVCCLIPLSTNYLVQEGASSGRLAYGNINILRGPLIPPARTTNAAAHQI